MTRHALALAVVLLAGAVNAAVFEPREFKDAESEAAYRQLTFELRCLVCQNQNIADSDADLAQDLRREVYERLERGETRADIVDFMTARYGEFILYRPRFSGSTAVLWGAPALLLLGGAFLAARAYRRRAPAAAPLAPDEAQRLRRHLANSD